MVPDGSPALRAAFIALAAVVAAALVWAVARAGRALGEEPREARRAAALAAAGIALWLAFTGGLAARGFLAFEPQPTMLPLVAIALAGALAAGFSRAGARLVRGLPLAALVGYQGFRIPVEALLARGHAEGLVPVQMTWHGMNFDVLTGVLALLIAALSRLGPVPRWLVAAWNLIGFGLLTNVVALALLSAPTPMRVFWSEPANVWITRFPFVWLPAFLVPVALLGHLLVLRWLFEHPRGQGPGAATAAGSTRAAAAGR